MSVSQVLSLLCTSACDELQGYMYAGVQFAEHCYCGDSYGRYGNAANCDKPCSGDASQMCGGAYANNVLRNNCNMHIFVTISIMLALINTC